MNKRSFVIYAVLSLLTTYNLAAALPQDSLLDSAMRDGRLRTAAAIALRQLSVEDNRMSVTEKVYYLSKLSEAHRRLGEQQQLEQWVSQMKKLMGQVDDSIVATMAKLEIAAYYMVENDFDKAMRYINQVMDFIEQGRHPELLIKMHRIMGGILSMSSRPKEALRHFRQAYSLSKRLDQRSGLLQDELNMSVTYLSLMKPDSAFIHLTHASQLAEHSQDTISMILNHAVWAGYFQQQQRLPECRASIEKSRQLAADIRHVLLLSNAYSMLTSLEMATGNYRQAIVLGEQALASIKDEHLPVYKATIDSLLYEAYKGTGDYGQAMQHFESFYRVLAEVRNQTHMEAIQAQQEAFLVKEKNMLIRHQQLELSMSRRKQRLMAVIILLMASLMAVFGLVVWLNRKYQRKLFYKEKMMDSLIEAEKHKHTFSTGDQIGSVALATAQETAEAEELEVFSEDRKDLYDEMLRVIEEQKLYLNPELNQKLLVTLLGTNRRYLYQAISQHAEDNFTQIINRYRLNEAKRLIEAKIDTGNDAFREDIYLAAGFNSVSSCYRAFKYFTGLTPREYHQAYRQERTRLKPK